MIDGVQNYMEIVVDKSVDLVMKSMGMCRCKKCRQDVCALALNNLKPMYGATAKGEVIMKIQMTKDQARADLVATITQSAKKVHENPQHE